MFNVLESLKEFYNDLDNVDNLEITIKVILECEIILDNWEINKDILENINWLYYKNMFINLYCFYKKNNINYYNIQNVCIRCKCLIDLFFLRINYI